MVSLKEILNFLIPSKLALSFYDDAWMNEITIRNNSAMLGANQVREMNANEIGVGLSGVYNQNRVSYYYLIVDYPRNLSVNWLESLRTHCLSGVSLSLLMNFVPDKIDWASHKMQTRMNVLSNRSKELREETAGKSKFQRSEFAEKLQRLDYYEYSVDYLTDATKVRNRGFFKVKALLIISGTKGELFDKSVADIENQLGANFLGFTVQRVTHNIPSVLGVFSPFSYKHSDTKTLSKIPKHTFSDEIYSRMNTYAHGIVGVRGIYVGSDKYSQFPVFATFKKRVTDAANILITAETGGGKSNLVKLVLLQLLGQGQYGTIMDIEGTEYRPMYDFLKHQSKTVIINMGAGTGKYFDPVEIPLPTGDPDVDDVSFNMSKNYTSLLLKLLSGTLIQEDSMYSVFIDQAISKTYADRGVLLTAKETWKFSKGLTLFDVYNTLKSLPSYYNAIDSENFKKFSSLLFKLQLSLSDYFEEHGSKAYMFQDRLLLSDFEDVQLVICSFGLAGKAPSSLDPVQVALLQLSASMFSYHRSITAFHKGLLNFKVWEEFQRWGSFEGSDDTIKVALTGGRKLGDTNFIITNDIKSLLDNDRFGIMDNLQVTFIGKIKNEETQERLLKMRSLLAFRTELHNLSSVSDKQESISALSREAMLKKNYISQGLTENEVLEKTQHINSSSLNIDDDWKWSFIYSDSSYTTVLKVRMPNSLSSSALFYTAPDVKNEKEEKEQKEAQVKEPETTALPIDFSFNFVVEETEESVGEVMLDKNSENSSFYEGTPTDIATQNSEVFSNRANDTYDDNDTDYELNLLAVQNLGISKDSETNSEVNLDDFPLETTDTSKNSDNADDDFHFDF